MRKIIPFLLMITIINAQAQQPVSLTVNGKVPAKSIIQSDFIAVHAADSFTISPNLQFNRPSNHLLKGAAKAIGAGALTWQLSNRLAPPAKENGKQASALPAIGVGMAVGLPDLVKGFRKNSQPALLYTFYTKDRVIIESKKVFLKKKGTVPVKGIVPVDGFMVVTLVNGRELKMVSGDVVVDVKKKEQYKGGMVANRNLRTMGDCLPPVVVCPPPRTERNEWDEGLTHYIETCITYFEPNNEEQRCDETEECITETWSRPDYVEYTYTEYYYEGDCTDCERKVTVWASGNETYGPPTCRDICGGDGGGGGGGNSDYENIVNNVSDPCIRNPLERIIDPPTPNVTSQLLATTFSPGRPFDVVFNQAMHTLAEGPGETWPPAAGSNDIEIKLSRLELDYAAREFVAAAILHEIYHAYMFTQAGLPTDQYGQHEYMIQNYIDDIANTLKSLYPSLDDETASALALGGFGDIQTNNPTLWDNILNEFGVTDAQVSSVNSRYKNALDGTPCQ